MDYAFDDHDIRTLVCSPVVSKRAGAAQRLCESFASRDLTKTDLQIAHRLLRAMAKDAAQLVRAALSVTLCNSPDLPEDVARTLAADIDTIAVPIIRFSPVLSDDDLVSVLRSRASAKIRAAALRARISVNVARTIVRFGDGPAVADLAANDGASIDEDTAREMVRLWHEDDLVAEAMVARRDMPLDVLEVLVAHTSAETALALQERGLPEQLATDVAERTRERATLEMSSAARNTSDLDLLIDSLHRARRLSGSLVFRAICQGHMGFAELALARMSRLPIPKVQVMLHDSGPFGLRALATRAHIPDALQPVLELSMRLYRDLSQRDMPSRAQFTRTLAERLATSGLALGKADEAYVLERLDAA